MPACPGTGSHSLSGATAVRPAASDSEAVPASRADLDRPLGSVPSPVTVLDQQSFEIGLPNIARINDALLGGSYDQLVEELGPISRRLCPPCSAQSCSCTNGTKPSLSPQ